MGFQRRLGPLLAGHRLPRWGYQEVDYRLWRLSGSGHTPARQKAKLLAGSATVERRTFIETGTYRGDMLARLLDAFDRLYSVERDPELYLAAVRRFRNAPKVTVYHGDSAAALSRILAVVSRPSVLWLDAHPAPGEPGEAALLSELQAILEHPGGGHRVLIDDIRAFSGERGWPSLLDIVVPLHRSGRVTRVSVDSDVMSFNVEAEGFPTGETL